MHEAFGSNITNNIPHVRDSLIPVANLLVYEQAGMGALGETWRVRRSIIVCAAI